MHFSVKRAFAASVVAMLTMTAMAQQAVRGSVQDAEGNPLIGATVFVDGKPVMTTDVDGNFSLPSASPKSVIKVSYVGFEDQIITLGNQKNLVITMSDDLEAIDEVVVVGYGTMRKIDLTGSVSSVNTEKLNAKGAPSVLGNLQGSVAGVNITQSSGRAGSGFNIEIRGKNSISSNQSPLYVVDGVICSDIDFLNPQDIERIDVLKDASSTAIYGSRATAGVVMVTTKSGVTVGKRSQKATVSYDGYYGFSKTTNMPDFMEADEYYQYRFLKFLVYSNANENGGQPVMVNDDPLRCLLYDRESGIYRMKELLANGQTYDWKDFVLQDGMQQNHYLAISGSSDHVNYHLGIGYNSEKGIYKNDATNKFNIKGSIDAKVTSWLSAGLNVNLARQSHDYASDNAVSNAFHMNAFMQPYDENGNVNLKPGSKEVLHTDEFQFTSSISPLIYIDDETANRLSWTALSNIYLQANPIKDLTIKTTFSPTFSYYRYGYYQGTAAGQSQNEARRQTSQGFSWTWDNTVTYDHEFDGGHHINVMGLVSSSYSNGENESLYYNNVLDGTYWWNIGTSDQGYNYSSSGSGYSETSLMSYALRANYSYKGRYMATGTIRWDGSSKFAEGNRWGSFPSAALAWRISEEPFMESTKEWLSNLKLRASYGVTGNNNVGAYATQLTLSGTTYYPFGSSYSQGTSPSGVIDRDLKWEKSHEVDFGIDFGFFHERIRGSVDYYDKKSTDLLYSVQLPLESGGKKLTTNIGSVRNRGIELELTTENVVTRNWHWTTSFTFAHNKNEVLEVNGTGNLYNGSSSTGNLFIGEPYNNVYGYEWDGIVSDREMTVPDTEIARLMGFTPGQTVREVDYYYACYGLIEGNPIIVDRNGDGKYTDDDKKIYKSDPDWTGSFTSNLSYRNWDLSVSLYAKMNYTIYSDFLNYYLNIGANTRGVQHLNADWYIPAGTLLDYDGIASDGTYINPVYQQATHYGSYPFPNSGAANDGLGTENWLGRCNSYADASFVKVKNITLGYTLPRKWLQKISCQQFRIYCTVTNPFVFTDYKGYDPEWASASSYQDGPSTVTCQFGVNVKF